MMSRMLPRTTRAREIRLAETIRLRVVPTLAATAV